MKTAKLEDIRDYVEDMFINDPEVARVQTLYNAIRAEGAEPDVEMADVEAVCEELVAEGFLQHAGREGYELTEEKMEEYGHEVRA